MTTTQKEQSLERHRIPYGTEKIEFSIIKSKRLKTSEIIVDSDDVIVRVPYSKSLKEIEEIVQEKSSWISKKIKENRENIAEIKKPLFVNNSTLPYLGNNYPLEVAFGKEDRIEFVDDKFTIFLKKSNAQKIYQKWLYSVAEPTFKSKIEKYSKIVSVEPKQIVIKKLKSRWGSVTSEGIVNLNLNLVKARDDVIDYVILHELCHFKIKEHSFQFWNLVSSYMADYKQKREWLEINSNNLV